MKISVSNIAWLNNELEEHLLLLENLCCDGVEIAPSCIWREPLDAPPSEIDSLKEMVSKYRLSIPALHALLFTRPDLHLFKDKSVRDETISYLKGLIKLAGKLSAKVLVYGSPKSRMTGGRPYEECYAIAVDAFRRLAKEASSYDTCFCIEPLGPSECDFINSAAEGSALVKDVGDPYFGLHLDAKAMIDSKEDFEKVFDRHGSSLKHFHVGDPGLTPPGHTGVDHSRIGKYLSRSPYAGYVSIEMRRGFGDTEDVVKEAVAYVRRTYNIA